MNACKILNDRLAPVKAKLKDPTWIQVIRSILSVRFISKPMQFNIIYLVKMTTLKKPFFITIISPDIGNENVVCKDIIDLQCMQYILNFFESH